MGIIHINQFGGLKLGVAKRDLTQDSAQLADSLSPLVQTFTPMQEDGQPQAIDIFGSGPVKSLLYYKTDTKTLFGATVPMNVARALVPDTDGSSIPRQRIYVTWDGSGPYKPMVFWRENDYANGRFLGVPPPKTKLKLTVVKKQPLTAETLPSAFDALAYEIWVRIEKLLEATWVGNRSGAERPGYLDCHASGTTGYNLGMSSEGDRPNQARVFGSALSGGIDPILQESNGAWMDEAKAIGMMADLINTPWVQATLPANPIWGKSFRNNQCGALVFKAFYPVYRFARNGPVWDELLDLTKPGLPDEQLLSSSELNAMLDRATEKLDVAKNSDLAQAISNMEFRYRLLTNMLDGKVSDAALANAGAVLNGPEATARIDQAYAVFAGAVYDYMQSAVNTAPDKTKALVESSGTLSLYSSDRAVSVAAITSAVKQKLAGAGGQITTQPIDGALALLNAEKLLLYKAVSASEEGKQGAVYQAALGMNFTPALRALYNATVAEAFTDLLATSAGGVVDDQGRLSASSVIAAIALLDSAYTDVIAVYLEAINGIKRACLEYLNSIGVTQRHGDLSGTEFQETRAYTWTLVNDWGEESMPYLPGNGNSDAELELLEMDGNDEVLVEATMPSLSDITAYGYSKWRLYRSNSSNEASEFQLVFEKPLATNTVTDKKASGALLDVLQTMTWEPPPVAGGHNLQGICALPNGFMAGFIDKTVYFSEVFRPYAWPSEYTHTFQHRIVGLGVFGQTLVVLTETGPWYLSGSNPSSMSKQETGSNQACVSARSICPVEGGVIFASPDGLCLASQAGVQIFLPAPTGKLAWTDYNLANIKDMQCAEYDGVLYFLYGGPTEEGAMWLGAMNLKTGKLVNVRFGAEVVHTPKLSAIYSDRSTDTLYGVLASTRQAITLFTDTSQRRLARFRTKRLTLESYVGFAWLRVLGEQSTADPAKVQIWGYAIQRDGSEVEIPLTPANGPYIITNTLPVRMPPGRYQEYEIEIESTARITSVTIASSTAELQAVP